MNPRQIHLPVWIARDLASLIFLPDGSEGFAFALAVPFGKGRGISYRVINLVQSEGANYDHRSAGGLTLSLGSSNYLNWCSMEAANAGMVPVHIHSHPRGVSTFSSYDDTHERETHLWLKQHGQPILLSMVWPREGVPVARVWAEGIAHRAELWLGLQVQEGQPNLKSQVFSRQSAFGKGLVSAAAQLHIGIIGVGGVGFLVAEQLARAGFRKFTLVDPDVIDETNLNRLPGCYASDLGRSKVKVLKRLLRRICRALGTIPQVVAIPDRVYGERPSTRRRLKSCDVLLALTDDELSRTVVLEIALDASAEYLQAGVEIGLHDTGTITRLTAEVTGAELGRYCPICTGRLDPGQASIDARMYTDDEVRNHAIKEGYIPQVPAPAVMSLNSLAAGALVLEIQRRVAGFQPCDLIQLDTHRGRFRRFVRIDRKLPGECEVCRSALGKICGLPVLALPRHGVSL